jgi:D-amino-acid oxidase
MLSRRRFLSSFPLFAGSCATRRAAIDRPAAAAPLAPVEVSSDRVIRTVAGLRPYRPSGFVLKDEEIEGKIVIHNYGHGGAGITLSWGCAEMAVELAARTGAREFAVLGSGVMGLSTARLLQRRGWRVTIYAKDVPPHTTSNVAGGLWLPGTLVDPQRRTAAMGDRIEHACRLSHRAFQPLAGAGYGVRWRPLYNLSAREFDPFAMPGSLMSRISDLFPERRSLRGPDHPFAASFALRYHTLLIEPAIYLSALRRDFLLEGGRIAIRDFRDPTDLGHLAEPVLVNCLGLGARALFGDDELTPVKGQLVLLLPQPEVNYCTIGPGGLYMFPRRDGILLGGTHEEGNWTLEPDPVQTERILRGNREVFEPLKAAA